MYVSASLNELTFLCILNKNELTFSSVSGSLSLHVVFSAFNEAKQTFSGDGSTLLIMGSLTQNEYSQKWYQSTMGAVVVASRISLD